MPLRDVHIIPDELDTIARTVAAASRNFDYVFTSGGVGPTHDDMTIPAIARGLGWHSWHLTLGRTGSGLILLPYQRYTHRIDAEEAMRKLDCRLLSALIIQVRDSSRSPNTDDIISILPTKGSQATYQAGDFSPDSSTIGMRLVEDQELKGSVDKYAQIFPARQQQFELVDVG